jgi:prepilin-type N-terminal cleavage/methylation domain-containing protein
MQKNKKQGFTLIEMLVVIAMIGLLSSVVLVALGPSRNKAKDARIISNIKQIVAIGQGYYFNPSSVTYDVNGLQNDSSTQALKADIIKQGISDSDIKIGGDSNGFFVCSRLASTGSFCADSAGNNVQSSSSCPDQNANSCS